MKRIAFLIVSISLIIACVKKETPPPQNCNPVTITAPAAEIAALQTYIDTNGITAIKDTRGFFYKIDSLGNGASPNVCSNVNVSYVGSFLNGTIFDQSPDITFNLSQLIYAWQEALPLLKAGGRITLYVPPSLGYGANTYGSIPGNSYLKFIIVLKGVS